MNSKLLRLYWSLLMCMLPTLFAYAVFDCQYQGCYYSNGVLIDGTSAKGAITIPDEYRDEFGVTYKVVGINKDAFKNNSLITAVSINAQIEEIKEGTFQGCTNLKSVALPSSLKTIGVGAFSGCKSLEGPISFPLSLEYIGLEAFSGCSSLKGIETNSPITIRFRTFYGCTKLGFANLNGGVDEIGESAFEKTGLGQINISSSIKIIGCNAFKNCSSLSRVVIPESNTTLYFDPSAFSDCGEINFSINRNWSTPAPGYAVFGRASELTLGEQVTSIPNHSFEGAPLKTLNISSSVKSIGNNAFSGCKNLTRLTIENGTESIGERAFALCENLKTVVIPPSVTSLGVGAFSGCSNLVKSACPESLNTGFDPNEVLLRYPVDCYIDNKGVIYDSYKTCIYFAPLDMHCTYNVPEGVTEIGRYAFYKSDILGVTLPKSLTVLGNYSFQSNHSLEKVDIPQGIRSISKYSFADCNIQSVSIPGSVETIGDHAFYSNKYLREVNIAEGVARVSDGAFKSCAVKSIVLPPSVHTINMEAFAECPLTSVTMSYNIRNLGEQCFKSTATLSSVTITTPEPPSLSFANPFSSYKGKLYVVPTAIDAYRSADKWNNFTIEALVMPEAISINKSQIEGKPGDKVSLKATVSPSDVVYKTVFWKSSNDNVASVDANGTVTLNEGAADGYCKITATTLYGDTPSGTCEVNPDKGPSIVFEQDPVYIKPNESIWIWFNLKNSDYGISDITYTIDNPSVAEVNEGGIVTGKEPGNAKVTCTVVLSDGSIITNSFTVIVADAINEYTVTVTIDGVGTVSLNGSDVTSMTIVEGNPLEITATPGDGYTFESLGYIMGDVQQTLGTSTISIPAVTADVTVMARFKEIVLPSAITIEPESITLAPGERVFLDIVYTPANTFCPVTWAVASGSDIVSVSSNGTVTAIKGGYAKVTATTENGLVAECIITVDDGTAEIEEVPLLQIGQKYQLKLLVGGQVVTNGVTWSIDSDLLSLSKSGVIQGISHDMGAVNITARTAEGIERSYFYWYYPTGYYEFSNGGWDYTYADYGEADGGVIADLVDFSRSNYTLNETVSDGEFEYTVKSVTISNDGPTSVTLPKTTKAVNITSNITSLTCYAVVPPAISNNLILAEDAVIYVPAEAVQTYQKSRWGEYYKVLAIGTVPEVRPTSMYISPAEVTLQTGEQYKLNVTFLPEGSKDDVNWNVTNGNNVVSVDSNGKITALASGQATVRAYTPNGLEAFCHVTVEDNTQTPTQDEQVTFNFNDPSQLDPVVETSNKKEHSLDGIVFHNRDIELVANGGGTTPRLWECTSAGHGIEYRLYNGAVLTIRTTDDNLVIKKIEITGAQLTAIELNQNGNGASYTWEDAAGKSSVSFNITTKGNNKRVDIATITVTYANVGAGVDVVAADNCADIEYYDLNGLRVSEPLSPGLYIRRQGTNVTKVVVR